MEAFADVLDLESRYRKLDVFESTKASVLLGDATAYLAAEHKRLGVEIDDEDDLQKEALKIVCCSMVKRILASGNTDDVTNRSITAGVYAEAVTYANPAGNMYITKDERRILGLPTRKQRLGSIAPKIGSDTDEG